MTESMENQSTILQSKLVKFALWHLYPILSYPSIDSKIKLQIYKKLPFSSSRDVPCNLSYFRISNFLKIQEVVLYETFTFCKKLLKFILFTLNKQMG